MAVTTQLALWLGTFWTPDLIFNWVFLFMWLTFSWDMYLAFRQYRVYLNTQGVPKELAGVLESSTLEKARAYQLDKTKFGFLTSGWSQILNSAVLLYDVLPFMWNYCVALSGQDTRTLQGEILASIVFVLVTSALSTVIDLPWSLYSNFVIEERHGFNKYTLGFYFTDKIKKFVVSQGIMAPILAVAIYIIRAGGDYFFLYLWLFTTLVTLALITIYPDFIAPLFDKFTPLPDSELKTEIERLAASIDFPLTKLYVVEGSKRSTHSNAYMYGFHKNKRIVLFDTLIEDYDRRIKGVVGGGSPAGGAAAAEDDSSRPTTRSQTAAANGSDTKPKTGCNDQEILAVLAHELGHWQLSHVFKNLIISEINLLFTFAVFGCLYQNAILYQAFGFGTGLPQIQAHGQQEVLPILIGLFLIFQYIFAPYNEVLSFAMTALCRRFEFQADAFAKTMHKSAHLRSALIKLNKDNLSFPVYDSLYSAWHHSHPPLLERIRALGKID